ncbi:MAG: threonine ammonia-lyase [Promethearchaeota archaeon]|nr:MAG: threonine ammonia-lyase [Candidatus Lokiarchaeota archaeon]
MIHNTQDFIKEIKNIRKNFPDIIHYTPLEQSHTFSSLSSNKVYLKLENFQRTGAFKIRGAYNKIASLSEKERNYGVITASAGNHGQAVALAAKIFGIKSIVVVPENSPIVKIEAIKSYNDLGKVIESGLTYDEAYEKALEIKKSENMTFIHAFNDMDVIKGQGTIGVEIIEQLPEVEYIICPIGGGGLISGVASYCKQINPHLRVIGVQSEYAPAMYKTFKTKEIESPQMNDTICDGIAVKHPGDITEELIKKYVDDIVLVSDEEVANAILLLLERSKIYVEGAGAAALASLLNKKIDIKNKETVVLVSGGNLTPNLLNRIIRKGLIKAGRLFKVRITLPDVPGALLKILKIIAEEQGNIVTITHEREKLELKYKKAEVIIEIETRNQKHIQQISEKLRSKFKLEILKF